MTRHDRVHNHVVLLHDYQSFIFIHHEFLKAKPGFMQFLDSTEMNDMLWHDKPLYTMLAQLLHIQGRSNSPGQMRNSAKTHVHTLTVGKASFSGHDTNQKSCAHTAHIIKLNDPVPNGSLGASKCQLWHWNHHATKPTRFHP